MHLCLSSHPLLHVFSTPLSCLQCMTVILYAGVLTPFCVKTHSYEKIEIERQYGRVMMNEWIKKKKKMMERRIEVS